MMCLLGWMEEAGTNKNTLIREGKGLNIAVAILRSFEWRRFAIISFASVFMSESKHAKTGEEMIMLVLKIFCIKMFHGRITKRWLISIVNF